MWRLCSRLLRGKRRQSSSLSAPSLRHAWGRLGRMSESDRREVVSGKWRADTPVQLCPDTSDRDAGGFVEVLRFRTDEEAQAFLVEESNDDAAEQKIPTLQLAQDFFRDLAQTANEEVDITNSLQTTTISDTERAAEEDDVHRHFFADFYIQQGLISEEERYPFVDAMLRPAAGMFCVNAGLPFVRLMLQCQLERHFAAMQEQEGSEGAVFVPHDAHPMLYTVDMLPTQRIGEKPRLPYTASQSVIAQRELKERNAQHVDDQAIPSLPLSDSSTSSFGDELLSADVLADMMMMTTMNGHDTGKDNEGVTVERDASDKEGMRSAIKTTPPSVGHLHWLQRQVATNTLADMDLLGLMIPLALVRRSNDDSVLLDLSSRTKNMRQFDYSGDICQNVAAAVDPSVMAVDHHHDNQLAESASSMVIVSFLPRGSTRQWEGRHDASTKTLKGSAVMATAEEVPTVGERDDATHPHREIGATCRVTTTASLRFASSLLHARCDMVLCAPNTTSDGLRPRVVIDDDSNLSNASPNHFVTLCGQVNGRFAHLCRELREAIECANPHDGRVLYATHSMNPLENEAVVCAVLQEIRRRRPELRCQPVSLYSGLSLDDTVVLQSLMSHGRMALTDWSPLDEGPATQDAANVEADIRQSVSAVAWRSLPLTKGCNGCFLCALEITSSNSASSLSSKEIARDDAVVRESIPWLDVELLERRFHLTLCTGLDGTLTLATPAAQRMAESLHGMCGMLIGEARTGCLYSSISGTHTAWMLSESVQTKDRSARVVQLPLIALLDLLDGRDLDKTQLSKLMEPDSFSHLANGTVFVKAIPPDLEGMELHSVVAAELEQLVLVVHVMEGRRGGEVTLKAKCETEAEGRAWTERALAISDALRYFLLHIGLSSVTPHTSVQVSTPVVLKEDEYDVELGDFSSRIASNTTNSLLSVAERRRHEGRMRRMSSALRAMGESPDGDSMNDWERDLTHNSHPLCRRTKRN